MEGGNTGDVCYYTLDESDPSDSENTNVQIGNMVTIDGNPGDECIIKTCFMKEGNEVGEVGNYIYVISKYQGGVSVDVASESVVQRISTVILYSDIQDAVIYYTVDGTMPTTSNYKGVVIDFSSGTPGTEVIVKAIAMPEGAVSVTNVASFKYILESKLAKVVASPSGGEILDETLVTLSAQSGSIYYTLDGETTPSLEEGILYTQPIVVDSPMIIKAIAIEDGYESSVVTSYEFTFAPQVQRPNASIATGEVDMNQEISFSTTTGGAKIYYTTNGTQPSLSDPDSLHEYTGPITITKDTTYCVMAVHEDMRDSDILTCRYTVREQEQQGTSVSETLNLSSNEDVNKNEGSTTILKDTSSGIVIKSLFGGFAQGSQLVVEEISDTAKYEVIVQEQLDSEYQLVACFDINLLNNGAIIQPTGSVQIEIPLPIEYQNLADVAKIAHISDDGTVELSSERLDEDVSDFKTTLLGTFNSFSIYGIVIPTEVEEKDEFATKDSEEVGTQDVTTGEVEGLGADILAEKTQDYNWLLYLVLIGTVLSISVCVILLRRRK